MKITKAKLSGACCLVPFLVGSTSAFAPSFITKTSVEPAQLQKISSTERSETALNVAGNYFDGIIKNSRPLEKTEKVITPAYGLALGSFAFAALVAVLNQDPSCSAAVGGICLPTHVAFVVATHIALFGAVCGIQAYNLRIILDKAGRFTITKRGERTLTNQGLKYTDNYVIGGQSSYRLDKFISYGFYPSVEFPILIYFKEVDTPKEKWKLPPPTKLDPKNNGMAHFLPAVCNCKELEAEFKRRGVPKLWK